MNPRQATIYTVLCALLCALFLSACGGTEPAGAGPADEEEDIAGRIRSETGSPHDYIGRWELTEYDGDAPFAYIEITEESPYTVSCYDADAGLIDTGFINYSEQRALNGNDLMVFIFKDIGEYGAQPYFVPDESYMHIRDEGQFTGTLTLLSD